jgi:uncharacterized membrane protein
MAVMVLDHTRDFVHDGSLRFDPTDLSQTDPFIFLTRWVTHFVAPVFVLLAGVGVYLRLARDGRKGELSRFLILRGLFLVLLELTIVRVGIVFNLDYSLLAILQVIWVLGIAMIVLAGLIHLPLLLVTALGLVLIVGHHVFDGVLVEPAGPEAQTLAGGAWQILHQPGPIFLSTEPVVLLVLYPLVPWIGVIAVGFGLGALWRLERPYRRALLAWLGVVMTVAFVVLRWANIYGDPAPWSQQPDPLFTVLSFLNVTKYPVSLVFLLMTLGPALVMLAWFDGRKPGLIGRPLVTLGRVPLFFYLLQWYVAHGIGVALGLAAGQSTAWQFLNPPEKFAEVPPNAGFELGVVYLAWLAALVILYPACRWYAAYKRRHPGGWRSLL